MNAHDVPAQAIWNDTDDAPGQARRQQIQRPWWRLVSFATVLLTAGCGPALGTPPTTCSTSAISVGESPIMEPGGDCIDCHSANRGPGFTFAGTVMNALNDDQNCQGIDAIQVRITDAAGKMIDMTTNSSGNFYSAVSRSSITFPYTAEVVRNGKSTHMLTPRSDAQTNCASCHTADGANGAPGRILAP